MNQRFAAVVFPAQSSSNEIEKPSYINDRELWNSFKSGNNSAFIHIYEKYFNPLYSYGYRIHPNEDLVKDAIHDVFLDLKKRSDRLGETDNIKFYLYTCIKRRIIKELKEWTPVSEEQVLGASFPMTFSHEHILIESQLNQERLLKLNEAIRELSPRKREAIYYVYYEGMSYQQVSDLMNLSDAKSARDLVYKALRCLRDSQSLLPIFILHTAT